MNGRQLLIYFLCLAVVSPFQAIEKRAWLAPKSFVPVSVQRQRIAVFLKSFETPQITSRDVRDAREEELEEARSLAKALRVWIVTFFKIDYFRDPAHVKFEESFREIRDHGLPAALLRRYSFSEFQARCSPALKAEPFEMRFLHIFILNAVEAIFDTALSFWGLRGAGKDAEKRNPLGAIQRLQQQSVARTLFPEACRRIYEAVLKKCADQILKSSDVRLSRDAFLNLYQGYFWASIDPGWREKITDEWSVFVRPELCDFLVKLEMALIPGRTSAGVRYSLSRIHLYQLSAKLAELAQRAASLPPSSREKFLRAFFEVNEGFAGVSSENGVSHAVDEFNISFFAYLIESWGGEKCPGEIRSFFLKSVQERNGVWRQIGFWQGVERRILNPEFIEDLAASAEGLNGALQVEEKEWLRRLRDRSGGYVDLSSAAREAGNPKLQILASRAVKKLKYQLFSRQINPRVIVNEGMESSL